MINYPEVRRIPTSYATGIGRVMARWAYLEWQLGTILCKLTRIGPNEMKSLVIDIDDITKRLQTLSQEIDAVLPP